MLHRRLESGLSLLLTAAAVAIAVVVVKREFVASSRPATGARTPEYYEDWTSMLQSGRQTGATKSPIKLIEFVDLECPACRQFHHATLRTALQKYATEVSFVFVHLPLAIHRFARQAAKASECAAAHGRFMEFVDLVFEKQDSIGLKPWDSYAEESGVADPTMFARCLADSDPVARVDSGVALAERLGVTGTPTVFINGWRLSQAPSPDELDRIIRDLIAGRQPFPKNQRSK